MRRQKLLSKKLKPLLLSAVVFFPATRVHAQETDDVSDPEFQEILTFLNNAEIDGDQLKGVLDLAVPENPLFTLMGTTPETVIRPKAGDGVAASLAPQVADSFGNEAFAIALEVTPAQFIMPKQFTYTEWQKKQGRLHAARWIEPLTLTLVANRSNKNAAQTQFGFGASYIYDSGAPLRKQAEFQKCLQGESGKYHELSREVDKARPRSRIPAYAKAAADFLAQQNPSAINFAARSGLIAYLSGNGVPVVNNKAANEESIRKAIEANFTLSISDGENFLSGIYAYFPASMQDDVELKAISAAAESAAGKAFDQFARKIAQNCAETQRPWNRNVYGAGIAVYHTSVSMGDPIAEGMMDRAPSDVTGFGGWASAAVKIADQGQITLHGRYTDDLVRERGSGDDAVTERVDAWSAAARYTYQFSASEDQKNPKARALRGFVEAAYVEEDFAGISDEFWQAGIGAEVQLRKDLFVQLVVGDTFGSEIDRSTYLSGQLKWAFSKLPAD